MILTNFSSLLFFPPVKFNILFLLFPFSFFVLGSVHRNFSLLVIPKIQTTIKSDFYELSDKYSISVGLLLKSLYSLFCVFTSLFLSISIKYNSTLQQIDGFLFFFLLRIYVFFIVLWAKWVCQ